MSHSLRRARRTVLVTGGRGRLAAAVVPELERQGWTVLSPGHGDLDVTRADDVEAAVRSSRPDVVVNLAAWTDADACQTHPERARLVNTDAVGDLADICRRNGAHFCHVSSDYVFDGAKGAPYVETDLPAPLSVYGATKACADELVPEESTLVRVGWLSGPVGRSLVHDILARSDDPLARIEFVVDQVGSPTVTTDVARCLARLIETRHPGLVHVASEGAASAHDLAQHVLRVADRDPDRVVPVSTLELRPVRRAPRPTYSALDTTLLRSMGLAIGPWQEAIERLVVQLLTRTATVPA